ncbi:hypothetical protein Mapa_014310 [Marchantia paleacea]|nr:hypothetical protein Mapa_014310 [Marchantia paleacea]
MVPASKIVCVCSKDRCIPHEIRVLPAAAAARLRTLGSGEPLSELLTRAMGALTSSRPQCPASTSNTGQAGSTGEGMGKEVASRGEYG